MKENGNFILPGVLGTSTPMVELAETVKLVAEDESSTVLILGESGTGKELIANAIHELSPRRDCHCVAVNCAAIPDELLESELFGYAKGAFTGATSSRQGRFKFADGGTMFLDEIGDMKPSLQSKLLRVMQEKEFHPIGCMDKVEVDVRIVAATHQDLETSVANGTFREDLFYRLCVVPIEIPSLAQRIEDVPLLLSYFSKKFNEEKGRSFEGFADCALDALMDYDWPGNVRELENLVQRLVILHRKGLAKAENLPAKYTGLKKTSSDFAFDKDNLIDSISSMITEDGQLAASGDMCDEDRLILRALVKAEADPGRAIDNLKSSMTSFLRKLSPSG